MTGLRAILYTCHATLLVSAVLQPPKNIRLLSENFKHILTWEDPSNVSAVYYSVEYSQNLMDTDDRLDGWIQTDMDDTYLSLGGQAPQCSSKFISTRNCSNITARRCDLTKDFTDIMGRYDVLVKSFANQTTAKGYLPTGFSPISNTILGPPIVDVVPCDHCIKVSIQPPVSYLWREEVQQNVTLLSVDVYPILEYTIQLNHSSRIDNIEVVFGEENNTVIPNLQPGANYCVSVTVAATLNLMPPIPSALKCVIVGSDESSTLYIAVPVVCVVILVILLLVLFALDRAGYIFMGKIYAPKVMKSFQASASMFSGSNEFSCPTCTVPVEIMENVENMEDIQVKEKSCGEGYATRDPFLTKSFSDTSYTASSGQLPTATSSSEESSGPTSDSSGGDTSTQLPAGTDTSAVSQGSCSSSTPLPVNALNKTSSSMFNNSGVFDINLNSVSIADPEDVWTAFEGAPSVDLRSPQLAGITLATDNCSDFPCVVSIDELRTSTFEGGSSEEEEEDSNANDGSDEHISSGYMRR